MSDAPKNRVPAGLERLLDGSGAQVSFVRPVNYGSQYRVERGLETVTLNVYTSGKVSTGGKRSGLLEEIEGWRLSRSGKPSPRSAGTAEPDGTARVGTDEAGKGDYFGPLVVAGVRVAGLEAARKLREAGARDSKTLSLQGARSVAGRILASVGPENARVFVLPPREYEARRRAAGNVNKLLAKVNVEIFGGLGDGVEVFVVDEFARAARSYIGPRLPEGVRLEVRPRAEDDVAVAAASVLARARYLEEMDALSGEVGFELPRGATHVEGAARRVVEERGVEGLVEVAKTHFGTTARVLAASGGAGGR